MRFIFVSDRLGHHCTSAEFGRSWRSLALKSLQVVILMPANSSQIHESVGLSPHLVVITSDLRPQGAAAFNHRTAWRSPAMASGCNTYPADRLGNYKSDLGSLDSMLKRPGIPQKTRGS